MRIGSLKLINHRDTSGGFDSGVNITGDNFAYQSHEGVRVV